MLAHILRASLCVPAITSEALRQSIESRSTPPGRIGFRRLDQRLEHTPDLGTVPASTYDCRNLPEEVRAGICLLRRKATSAPEQPCRAFRGGAQRGDLHPAVFDILGQQTILSGTRGRR